MTNQISMINELFIPITSDQINEKETQVVSVKQTAEEVIEQKLSGTKETIKYMILLGVVFVSQMIVFLFYKKFILEEE